MFESKFLVLLCQTLTNVSLKYNFFIFISSKKDILKVKSFNKILFFSILSLVIPSPGAQLTSGQQLKLSCTTGEPLPPDMQLKWVLPKTSPQLLTDQHSANLTFPEVRTADSGNWRCELWWNNISLVSAVITLQIGENRKQEIKYEHDFVATRFDNTVLS